jgi:hypothetical protein
MTSAAALCAVHRPTPTMAAPGDDGYTYTNPRATPKRDQGRQDAPERQDHAERLVRRYSGEVTAAVEWQCGLIKVWLAARRGRGDKGAQGGARDAVWLAVMRWRAHMSSSELVVSMALGFSARRERERERER